MNLALPALVILLGLLPGLACFYGYFAGRFDKRTAGVTGVEEVALYIILAIPLDAAAAVFFRWAGTPLHFEALMEVLAGNIADVTAKQIAGVVSASFAQSAVIYSVTLLASFAVGSAARRFVWACRLDTFVRYFRLKHEWFYLLQGRVAPLPREVLAYVDVLTEHPDGSRLYKGFVVDFKLGGDGALESLTLSDAVRGHGRGSDFAWKDIPSDRLVIMGPKIHSLNITYIAIEDELPASKLARARYRARRWCRSFIYEEP